LDLCRAIQERENVLILRHNPDIVHAYAANWRRHYAEALPYAAQ